MNSSLHDIQSDIQRLASQQSQMQAAQQQSLLAQQQRQLHAMQQQQYFQHQQQLQNMQQQYPAQPFGIYQQPGESVDVILVYFGLSEALFDAWDVAEVQASEMLSVLVQIIWSTPIFVNCLSMLC